MNLLGERVKLRQLELEDMNFLNKMINDNSIQENVVGWSKPITMEEQVNWFKNLANDKNFRYAICLDNHIIGSANIRNIDWKNKTASFDIKIMEEFTKKGYGLETINLLLDYSFNELNMNRIFVNILEYNKPSRKLFEKCGFVLEGVQREAIYKKGKYNDIVMYSILKKEFIKND